MRRQFACRMSAARGACAVLTLVCVVLAPGAPRLSAEPHVSLAAFVAAPASRADESRSAGPAFRLGDAARPFGWSTVVGDFNTDGMPDVAVADHIASAEDRYAFRIEFAISGEPARDVTFESTEDAVTIRVADVDHDNDLDVIVGTPLSGETVGVWLNDGRGHFTAGSVREAPAALQGDESLDHSDPLANASAAEAPPRRADDAIRVAIAFTPSISDGRRLVHRAQLLHRASSTAPATPRAPPAVDFELHA